MYFGDTHWNEPKNLIDLLEVPEGLEDFVNDYKIHVYEIAFLSDEEINRFNSDFKLVAKFFQQKRLNPNFEIEGEETIKHVDEVLKLLSVFEKNGIYIKVRDSFSQEKKRKEILI